MRHTRTYKQGFTLVEIIIAITLLVIGVVAVFGLVFFAINLNRDNVMRVQALELAREGMEIVRNVRDTNWKNNYPFNGGAEIWGVGLDGTKTIAVSPTFSDQSPFDLQAVTKGDKASYRLNTIEESGVTLFTHGQGKESPFYRYVELSPVSSQLAPAATDSEVMKVTVTVLWNDSGKEKKVEITEVLTNWRKV